MEVLRSEIRHFRLAGAVRIDSVNLDHPGINPRRHIDIPYHRRVPEARIHLIISRTVMRYLFDAGAIGIHDEDFKAARCCLIGAEGYFLPVH